jgi:hypothetical protein
MGFSRGELLFTFPDECDGGVLFPIAYICRNPI